MAPCLESGSLKFPHLGDCTQLGQPWSQGQDRKAASVASRWAQAHVVCHLRNAGSAWVRLVDEDGRPGGIRGGNWSTIRRCPSGRKWRTGAASRSRRVRRRAGCRGDRVVRSLPPRRIIRHRQPDALRLEYRRRQIQGSRPRTSPEPSLRRLVGHDMVLDMDRTHEVVETAQHCLADRCREPRARFPAVAGCSSRHPTSEPELRGWPDRDSSPRMCHLGGDTPLPGGHHETYEIPRASREPLPCPFVDDRERCPSRRPNAHPGCRCLSPRPGQLRRSRTIRCPSAVRFVAASSIPSPRNSRSSTRSGSS